MWNVGCGIKLYVFPAWFGKLTNLSGDLLLL